MNNLLRAIGAALLACCLYGGNACAAVVVTGTRIVMQAQEPEVTVRLSNEGDSPVLVQCWIDKGDPHAAPESLDVPFLLTPAIFRMEPKKGQSLRLLYTHDPLPSDRESLFWLNVLEIPPRPGAGEASQNTLQIAVRSRLKLFFRPQGLKGDALTAHQSITWTLASTGQGYVLQATNPTPYHVTFSEVSLDADGQHYPSGGGMIEPFGSLRMAVKGLQRIPAQAELTYAIIDDYGAAPVFKAPLGH